MRSLAAALVLIGLATVPLGAQGRGRSGARAQGVPPGHLPPPGECRVWYDGVPPGQQPPPTSCREAERVASRDRYARVIYGSDRGQRDDGGWYGRDDRGGRDRGRAIPRRDPSGSYPDRYPSDNRYPYPDNRYPYPDSRYPYPDNRYPYPDRYPNRGGGYGYEGVPYDNGYKDGYEKGREDARDNDSYDPVRHSRYRSGDRGYDRRYGTKEEYKRGYREGFSAGYDEGYRATSGSTRDRRQGGTRFPWPF